METDTLAPAYPEPAPANPSARDKLDVYGPDGLGDVEIVSLLLPGGPSPLTRAATLLESAGGLLGLARGRFDAPPATRATLLAAIELGRRIARCELPWAHALRGPDDVARWARATLGNLPQENFVAIGLDARQRVRSVRTIAIGSVAQVDVHPREVFRDLIAAGLHSCIVVHNHPSGEPEPSQSDVDLTRRLADVGRIVGIPLLDHLVVTGTRSCSLAAMGLVPGA